MKKKQRKTLMWGLIGLGALYLLTRDKSKQAPVAQNNAAAPPRQSYRPASNMPASAMGLPYTYNAEI
jgi:hypothetical protein